jgi:hypothetical protein
MKSEANKKKAPTPVGLRRLVRLRRTCWSISNDISEGLPVTKDELLRVVKWERKNTHRNQIAINRLRDAMVKIGLMLTTVERYSPRHHEIFKVISDALKQPNEKS